MGSPTIILSIYKGLSFGLQLYKLCNVKTKSTVLRLYYSEHADAIWGKMGKFVLGKFRFSIQ